jgi:hypothetical protein
MSPYFLDDPQDAYSYGARRRGIYQAALAAGFGEDLSAFRAVERAPGLTWRSAAIGLTLASPEYRGVVPRGLRRIVDTTRGFAERSVLDYTRAGKTPPTPGLPAGVRFYESLPEPIFIRWLETLHYPLAAYQALSRMWDFIWERLRGGVVQLTQEVYQAGQAFLGSARLVRDRLRAGGLLSEDREILNLLTLGGAGEVKQPAGRLVDVLYIIDWIMEGFRRPKPPQLPPIPTPAIRPGQPGFSVHHRLWGLELETRLGDELIAYSTFGNASKPSLLIHSGLLSANPAQAAVLDLHERRWQLENNRRLALFRLSSLAISVLLEYIVLGPAGLMAAVLKLLSERLLDVAVDTALHIGRLVLPAILPDLSELVNLATSV